EKGIANAGGRKVLWMWGDVEGGGKYEVGLGRGFGEMVKMGGGFGVYGYERQMGEMEGRFEMGFGKMVGDFFGGFGRGVGELVGEMVF
ncbi:hypothetical protein, partial [Neisseria sicca]|uniref:hypothetical protein n=1 Tax=Neisseria sicca TaxID=490 RepID=UPI001C9A0C7A